MKPLLLSCLVLAAALLPAADSSALIIEVTGQNFPADVSATVELVYDGVSSLVVEIENTSDASVLAAAFVTGFAFNVPAAITGISGLTAIGTLDDSSWVAFFPPSGPGNAPGGYVFDAGAGTGPNVAGGTPGDGFDIGSTATFTITFTGTGLGLLTANDFVGETEDGAGGPADFGVRFQGVLVHEGIPADEGSDFALHRVPAPGAALLLLTGLPAALACRLR